MPTYDFKDTKTGKVWTDLMSIAEKGAYLKKNKHIKQLLTKINISSGVMGVGGLKTDGGWKEVLGKVSEKHPDSPLADRYSRKSIKDVKTRQVVEKHRHKWRSN